MLFKKTHRLMMTLSISGLFLAQSCQLLIDPVAAIAVADRLSQCDFEFDDGDLEEIECGDRRNDDFFWRPWWWF